MGDNVRLSSPFAVLPLSTLFLAVFYAGPAVLDLGQGLHWWSNIGWLVSSAAAMLACTRAASFQTGEGRLIWVNISRSCACLLMGNAWWAIYDLRGVQPPFPGLADAGYLFSCLFFMKGLLQYGKCQSSAGRIQTCNFALTICATLTTAFVLLFPYLVASKAGLLGTLVAFLYPGLWFGTAGFGLIYLLLYAPRDRWFVVLLLFGGIVAQAVADIFYGLALMDAAYQVGKGFDGLWVLSFLLIACAAIEEVRKAERGVCSTATLLSSEGQRLVEALIPAVASALILLSGITGIMSGFLFSHSLFLVGVPLVITFAGTLVIREYQSFKVERDLREAAEWSAFELEESRKRMAAVLDSTTDSVLVIRPDGYITYMNHHAKEFAGQGGADFEVGANLWDVFPEEVGGTFQEQYHLALETQTPVVFEAFLQAAGAWLEVHAYPVSDTLNIFFRDVTERREAEEKMQHLAHHDPLTGLANRLLLRKRLIEVLASTKGSRNVAVLYMDLDHFKEVNDTLGHPTGDALLIKIAGRLRTCVDSSAIVARLGGDEFAVISSGWQSTSDVSGLAQKLIDTLSAPYDLDGQFVRVGVSVGIAVPLRANTQADALFKKADIALYSAKEEGRGRFHFFEPAMEERLRVQQSLRTDLATALEKSEFELVFQPLVDLHENNVCGFEALLRWRHPERGAITPDAFIPVAEETGLINGIGEWVLNRACAEATKWPSNMRVAVNLSPRQFQSDDLPEIVARALSKAGLAPGRLELEITESVLLQDSDANLRTLHKLRELGVRMALDDFGTGYSSLGYLQKFPFDKIKIDRSFVADLPNHPGSEAIIRSVTELGRSLGMSITAEGVEARQQLNTIIARGCDEAQGYFFSKPVPANDIDDLLAQFQTARNWWPGAISRRAN
jgi:diguanylate cyclase (GGDEF)-like protein/PAS domain S-box-containing protein